MAKKKAKRRGRKKGSASLNLTKIRQEIKKQAEKQLVPVRKKIASLEKQRDSIQAEIEKLEKVVQELSDVSPKSTGKRGRPAGRPKKSTSKKKSGAGRPKGGGRGKNQKFILDFVKRSKGDVRVSDITAAARKKDMNVSIAVKTLIDNGTLKAELPEGAKRNPYVTIA